jgi:cell wall-associated NlpC family hydrolase
MVMSDMTAIGGGDGSGVAAIQARIAQLSAQFGMGGAGSFQSALSSASSVTADGTDTTAAAALGVDPSTVAAGTSAAGGAGSPAGTGLADKVVAEAKKYLGVKYVWGGESPTGFDCSGLTQYVYKKFGVDLPRVASDQAHSGKAVSAADARPGDLVFFHNPASHVGIYLGKGMMLDAPNSSSHVRIEKVWAGVSGYRRVLPDNAFAAPPAVVGGGSGGSPGPLTAKLPAAGKQYASMISSAAAKNGIDPKLLAAVAWTESGFRANAVSPAGAQGLVQLMPATARGLGVNALNPAQALDGGARYLAQQLKTFGGRTDLAIAAYNAGPSAVRKYGGVPPYSETQNYVRTVESKMALLSGSAK